jgi:hypothetical protein
MEVAKGDVNERTAQHVAKRSECRLLLSSPDILDQAESSPCLVLAKASISPTPDIPHVPSSASPFGSHPNFHSVRLNKIQHDAISDAVIDKLKKAGCE